jgi:PAS domain S-box-containing protein
MPEEDVPSDDRPVDDGAGERQMAAWIDAAPVAMLVADPSGRIVVANRAACDLFGHSAVQFGGMRIDALVPERLRSAHQGLVDGFFRAMSPRMMGIGRDVLAVDAAGREFPVEIGLSPVRTPGGDRVVATVIDLTERRRREKESTLARLVQQALLPRIPGDVGGLEIAARSEPADATGGDFYDLFPFSDGRVGIVVGDASGHGFAAALVTATARSYLRALVRTDGDLGAVLRTLNDLLVDDGLDGRFVTLLCAVVDPRRRRLDYAGAGHAGYLLDAAGGLKSRLDRVGLPLGWEAGSDYAVTSVDVEENDLLVLMSDGIEESIGRAGGLFGAERVLALLGCGPDVAVADLVASLFDAVAEFRGPSDPHDDATAILTRIRPIR